MESARGRWFLQEFARRRRAEASAEILAAIARLEARGAAREAQAAETRREAANAAVHLAETVRKLHAFALGFSAEEHESLSPPSADPPGLDRGLTALQALDALDVAAKLRLFG